MIAPQSCSERVLDSHAGGETLETSGPAGATVGNSRWAMCGRAIAGLWPAWTRLAQSLFGAWAWEAPAWLHLVTRLAARAGRCASRSARRRPRLTGALLLAIAALAAGGELAWRWAQLLPKPHFAVFTIAAPGRTHIENENHKPDPLTVRFDVSAASLALAGKSLPNGS